MTDNSDPVFDRFMSRVRVIASLSLGTVIVLQQLFLARSAQPILIGLAALLLGLPLTRVLDRLVP